MLPANLAVHRTAFRTLPGIPGDAGLVACGFMRKDAGGLDNDMTARPAYSAVLVLRGLGRFTDHHGVEHELSPGRLFQRSSGLPHRLWIAPGSRWCECWIHLGPAVERMLRELEFIDDRRTVLDPGIDLAVVRELLRTTEALAAAPDHALPGFLIRLQGLLIGLLAQRGAMPSTGPDLDRACRLLADGASPQAVAAALDLPYHRFRKLFATALGLGPAAYRLRRRLEWARGELAGTDRSIAAIADDLGYANPFVFSQVFKDHVGVAPTAWRRGARP